MVNDNFLKFLPVMDLQSFFITLSTLRNTALLHRHILLINFRNRFLSECMIWGFPVRGSIRYLWVLRGKESTSLCDTFQDFFQFLEI